MTRPPPNDQIDPPSTTDTTERREQSDTAAPPPAVVTVTFTREQARLLLEAAQHRLDRWFVRGSNYVTLFGATGILSTALKGVHAEQTGGGDG